MNKKILTFAVAVAFTTAIGQQDLSQTQPASVPASIPTAASEPASAPAPDAAALKILDSLEQAGLKHKTIQADIDYTVVAGSWGDKEIRTGYVLYAKSAPDADASFRIHFNTLRQGEGAKIRELVDYAFTRDEGGTQWLIIAEHANRKLRRVQVAAEGQNVEPLRIGKGPFPLPFGQKASEVVKYFIVTTRPLEAGEPEKTDYIKLVPKPEYKSEMNFTELQMWVDQGNGLPAKVISRESNKTRTTVIFSKLKTNHAIENSSFSIERPTGWKVEVTPLEKKQQ